VWVGVRAWVGVGGGCSVSVVAAGRGRTPSASRRKLLLLLLTPQTPLVLLTGSPLLPGAWAIAWLVPLLLGPMDSEPE